jgi:hypothetical protein
MTQDEIIEMAKEAGFDIDLPAYENGTALAIKLAKLVAAKAKAKEREACAKVAESNFGVIGSTIAIAIRARGEE